MPDSAGARQRTTAAQTSPSSILRPKEGHVGPSTVSGKTQYLVLYNLISLILWLSVLLRTLLVLVFTGGSGLLLVFGNRDSTKSASSIAASVLANIYPATSNVLLWTQTVAVIEVVHAALGLVRASVFTTAMQVSSRLLLVWGILDPFGRDLLQMTAARKVAHATGLVNMLDKWGLGERFGLTQPVQWNQAAYTGLLIAWTVTEVIRYLYFVFFLGNQGSAGGVPSILSWLRYNTFFVLYPLGISSECWLIYHAIPFAKQVDERYAWALWAILGIYVPGSYILYTHMMAQRRRVIKGKQKARTE